MQTLSLAKECYSMKLELLTNATVVDDGIRFVSSNTSKDKEESREPNKVLLVILVFQLEFIYAITINNYDDDDNSNILNSK